MYFFFFFGSRNKYHSFIIPILLKYKASKVGGGDSSKQIRSWSTCLANLANEGVFIKG